VLFRIPLSKVLTLQVRFSSPSALSSSFPDKFSFTVDAKDKAASVTGMKADEAKGKAAELKGEAKGKAEELKGEAKGKAEEVKGKM
jgi:uncharacterized protein YjbJ (UPF0337 family)